MKQVKDEMKLIRKENIDNFLVTDQEIKQRESERRAKQKALHHALTSDRQQKVTVILYTLFPRVSQRDSLSHPQTAC